MSNITGKKAKGICPCGRKFKLHRNHTDFCGSCRSKSFKEAVKRFIYINKKCTECRKLSHVDVNTCNYCLNNKFYKKRYDKDGFD